MCPKYRGKINKFFYIKDHLGSVRVVLNSDNQIVSAIDYDCWGYPLENRSYQSDNIDYKFTGKQRDAETGGACPDMHLIGNYFGARYYDARIGRWGGVEPLLEKYISYSPYQYGLLNPINLFDVDGREIYLPRAKYNFVQEVISYMQNEKNGFFSNHNNMINIFNSTSNDFIISDGDGRGSETLYSDDILANTSIAFNPKFGKVSLGESAVNIQLGSDFFDLDLEIAAIIFEHELHHAEYYSALKNSLKTSSEYNKYFEKDENLKGLYEDEISAYTESIKKLDDLKANPKNNIKEKTYKEIRKNFEAAKFGYLVKRVELSFNNDKIQ